MLAAPIVTGRVKPNAVKLEVGLEACPGVEMYKRVRTRPRPTADLV